MNNAIQKMINDYSESRKKIASEIRQAIEYRNGLRKNSKQLEAINSQIEYAQSKEAEYREKIYQLDQFESVVDEFEEIETKISELVEKRNSLVSPLLASEYRIAKRGQ